MAIPVRSISVTRFMGFARVAFALTVLVTVVAPPAPAWARRCACIRSCCLRTCGSCLLRPSCQAACDGSCTLDCGNPDLDIVAFDASGTIRARDGRQVGLSGPLKCKGEADIRELRVTLTQEGVVGEGHARGTCPTTDGQSWQADVKANGGGFVAGPAVACGLAVTENSSGVSDTHQWCATVDLQGETD